MRNATLAVLAALVLVVVLPATAHARMVVKPMAFDMDANTAVRFRIELYNLGKGPEVYAIDPEAEGLLVSLDREETTIPPGGMDTLYATVRAPPWSAGNHTVRLPLFEGDEGPIETQEVQVRVRPWNGWDPEAVRMGFVALGVGGLGGLLGGLVAWRRWHFVAFALYARVRRENVERHPSRARLVAIARARPGVTLAEAQREAGLANGPFEHHLAKLVRSGRLVVEERGRARLLRLAEDRAPPSAPDASGAVAAFVRERGPVRAAVVARELAMSRQALHYHVRKLAEEGVLDARVERGRLVLTPVGAA